MKDNKIQIVQDGKMVEYDIILLCRNVKSGYNYVIYGDKNEYYASRYKIIKGNLILEKINDEEEWNFIDKELEKVE